MTVVPFTSFSLIGRRNGMRPGVSFSTRASRAAALSASSVTFSAWPSTTTER